MSSSTRRIATTHTGSLPRPADLTEMLVRRDHGEAVDGFDERVAEAVKEIVRLQADHGITIVNDGEVGKISYATYVKERMDGFGGVAEPEPWGSEADEFPDFYERVARERGPQIERPACDAPVRYRGLEQAEVDIANLKAAVAEVDVDDAFMTAASPGIIAGYLPNVYYGSHEEYIWALAEEMKQEYDAIHAAGFLLQLDCPDLTNPSHPIERARLHIDALNHATRDIPPERMRLHLCWGNGESPHTHDVPMENLIDVVLNVRPGALSFEGANPRHAHEWRVFADGKLPKGKTIIPGVIDSTTNFVEHPRLVADRIVQYAELVGPENVAAGTDCGMATWAIGSAIAPSVAWAKLAAMGEGAALATNELF
jgi:5-methyltetrahydropteroyltriglutamate--homocysteine methyltransferase